MFLRKHACEAERSIMFPNMGFCFEHFLSFVDYLYIVIIL